MHLGKLYTRILVHLYLYVYKWIRICLYMYYRVFVSVWFNPRQLLTVVRKIKHTNAERHRGVHTRHDLYFYAWIKNCRNGFNIVSQFLLIRSIWRSILYGFYKISTIVANLVITILRSLKSYRTDCYAKRMAKLFYNICSLLTISIYYRWAKYHSNRLFP
jgi:hypothetical protein